MNDGKPVHVTQTARDQWGKREGLPGIDAVLRTAREVTDFSFYRNRPENGAVLWESPDCPQLGFLVKVEPIRDVVIGLMHKRRPESATLAQRVEELERRLAAVEKELAETEVVE